MALKIDRKQLETAGSIAKMGMGGDVNYRISIFASIILIMCAGVFDLLSLIPLVGDFLGPLFWAVASLYFWKAGLGLINARKLAVTLVSMAGEMIGLPFLMVGVVVIIAMTRIEDKTGLSLNPLSKKAGVTAPRMRKTPVNSTPGVRLPRQKPEGYDAEDEDLTLAA